MTAPTLRDEKLVEIESYLRQAIRDAVNRPSRKPFAWGGLSGYQQMEAIAQALYQVQTTERESHYLHWLTQRVERVLVKNRSLAEDLQAAHQGLCQMARCLRYPPPKPNELSQNEAALSSQQVAQEMESLIQQFHPIGLRQQAQKDLISALEKRWKLYGPELLHCYDIPGLPQDNLQLEALFGRLRRHQRRISGRQSTRELHDFGQAQVLFQAESQTELLQQIQHVSQDDYLAHRQCLAQAEFPRQFSHRLHHDPLATILTLLRQHSARRLALLIQNGPS